MINAMVEALTTKTTDQYKVIEEKYWILRRFLLLFFEAHASMHKEDAELILSALEGFPYDDDEEENDE